MSRATSVSRIEALEQQVGPFESRFDSLDAQIADFRRDVDRQFVEVRQEIGVQISQLREEMRSADAATHDDLLLEVRTEGAAVRDELRTEIRAEGAAVRDELRTEIKDGDETTRRYMLVLHEEVIDRIKRLAEARS